MDKSGVEDLKIYWGTPILEIHNPDHDRIKTALTEYLYQLSKDDGGGIASGVAPNAKSGLYESRFNLFKGDSWAVQELRQFCTLALRQALVRLDRRGTAPLSPIEDAQIELHESWAHITRDGGFHEPHMHANCSWCGIYYVHPGETSMDPRNGANEFFPPFVTTYGDRATRGWPMAKVSITSKEGYLVLFPSYLRHLARTYHGGQDRIVVAFNARVFDPERSGAETLKTESCRKILT